MAEDWKRRSVLKSWAISRTRRCGGERDVSALAGAGGAGGGRRAGAGPHLERQLADEQLRGLLVLADLAQGDGARPVAVGLRGRRRVSGWGGGVSLPLLCRLETGCAARTFFTPPVAGADLRAALVASCLRGALPPVDLLRGREVSGGRRRSGAVQGERTEPSAWCGPLLRLGELGLAKSNARKTRELPFLEQDAATRGGQSAPLRDAFGPPPVSPLAHPTRASGYGILGPPFARVRSG